MKKIYILILAFLLASSVFAQTPDKMSYQAVIRNNTNGLVTNSAIGMRISIVKGSAGGTSVYVETHTPASNANGLVSVQIGGGTPVSGNFASIDWSSGSYFIKSESDPAGGTNYTIIGTTQLLSVPYALHSKTAQNVLNNNDKDADTTNELQTLSKAGATITLSNGGGSFIDEDADSANEIQTLAISNDTLRLSSGGGEVVLPKHTAWALGGNEKTIDGKHFIGTIDNIPLNFRVNNEAAGRIDPSTSNTSYGYQTLLSNSAGEQNTANGFKALYSNTTGWLNTANGYISLFSNTSGKQNVANGVGTLNSNTTGESNTATGAWALRFNVKGNNNTATGVQALYYTEGSWNTACGSEALFSNITGNNNTAMGHYALRSNVLGDNNTAVGYLAFTFGANYSNSTALGANTSITASNQMRFGNNLISSIGGNVSWSNVSDRRFKKDISENVPGLDFITKLRPVTYHLDMDAMAKGLNTPDSLRNKESEAVKGKMLQTGFLAQEVEKTAQALNYDFSGVDKPKNDNDFYGLRYAEFTVPLVKAVQELDDKNKALEKQNEELKKTLALLLKRVEAIEAKKAK